MSNGTPPTATLDPLGNLEPVDCALCGAHWDRKTMPGPTNCVLSPAAVAEGFGRHTLQEWDDFYAANAAASKPEIDIRSRYVPVTPAVGAVVATNEKGETITAKNRKELNEKMGW